MVRPKVLIVLVVFTFAMCAVQNFIESASAGEIKILGETSFTEDIVNPRFPIYLVPTGKDIMWMLFSNEKQEIILKNTAEKQEIILNKDIQGTSSGTVWCEENGKLYVAWRAKAGDKNVYFRSVNLSSLELAKPIEIGGDSQPLPRLKLECTGNVINLVWLGEKPKGKTRYSIYASRSFDGGQTFSDVSDVTPQTEYSIYPSLITDSNGNAYVFSEVVREGKREMVFRMATKDGWLDPISIGEIGILLLPASPLKVGNRLIVFWFNSYEGVPVTEMAYSDDGGKTWTRNVLEATRNFDLSALKAVSGDEQNIYLVMSGVNAKEQQQNPKNTKDTLVFFYSHDGGKTFSGPVYIRHDPFGLYTRAQFPHITAKGKNVVVVWNDYRNIRSNIYMNYSTDGGVTWQPKDIPLEEPGKFNTLLHWNANNLDENNLVEVEGKYYILAYRFTDDSLEKAYPVLISFKIKK